jgi:cytochrome P450
MTDTAATCPLRLSDLPVGEDRAGGWRMLRDAGKVVDLGDALAITQRDVAEFTLKHPELFSSRLAFESLGSPLPLIPIAVDPPEHARYRRMLDPFFGPRRLAELESSLRAQVVEIIERFSSRGGCDIVSELAIPYPTQVFLTLFGLPLEDRDRFIGWKDAVLDAQQVVTTTEPNEAALAGALELYEYLAAYVVERRRGDGNDLLSQILAVVDEGGMSDDEVIGLGFLFVLAGLDTVTSAIGLSFAQLATRPDLRRRVVETPSSIPSAVEEFLRTDVPVPFVPRIATDDVELGGTTIPRGTLVQVCIGAANRDPDALSNPDAVDFDRSDGRHLGFGGGVHRCLGSHLARMELRLVLEEFHRRIPDYELAPGASPHPPWPTATIGLERLPLVFTFEES